MPRVLVYRVRAPSRQAALVAGRRESRLALWEDRLRVRPQAALVAGRRESASGAVGNGFQVDLTQILT
jgi:hypothetical protein